MKKAVNGLVENSNSEMSSHEMSIHCYRQYIPSQGSFEYARKNLFGNCPIASNNITRSNPIFSCLVDFFDFSSWLSKLFRDTSGVSGAISNLSEAPPSESTKKLNNKKTTAESVFSAFPLMFSGIDVLHFGLSRIYKCLWNMSNEHSVRVLLRLREVIRL